MGLGLGLGLGLRLGLGSGLGQVRARARVRVELLVEDLEGARVPRARRRCTVLEGNGVLRVLGFTLGVGLGLARRS